MTYKALYRKYRPIKFSEVVGQKIVVQTLKNSLDQDKIAHAYLFSGPRGTGKTTIAKIFARTINCTGKNKPCGKCENCKQALSNNHPDIIEIDAASHNGVEEIRSLIDQVQYAPLLGKSKIYIIDEAHMMSTGAFNALLKTIEEPPENVIFILATTEPHKIISTILSRCQKLEFSKVSIKDLSKRIKEISKDESISIDDGAIELIAQLADGGVRDSLSILDQCLSYENPVTVKTVQDVFGLISDPKICELLLTLENGEISDALEELNTLYFSGADLRRFIERTTTLLKNSLIIEQQPKSKLIPEEQKTILRNTLLKLSASLRYNLLTELLELSSKMGNNQTTLDRIETIFLKSALPYPTADLNFQKSTELLHTTVPISEKENMNKLSENHMDRQLPSENTGKDLIDDSTDQISDVSRETFMNDQEFLKTIDIDEETLIQILVNSNKDEKSSDNSRWKNFDSAASDLTEMRLASSLGQTLIFASSPTTILLSTSNEAVAEEINELEDTIGYRSYLLQLLGKEKDVVAVTRKRSKEITQLFMEKRKNNTLPAVNHNFRLKSSENEESLEEFLKTQFKELQVVND